MATVGTFRIGFLAVAKPFAGFISAISASSVRYSKDDEAASFSCYRFLGFSLCLCASVSLW